MPPAMNPRYYPAVSRLLQQHFPDRYNRVAFGEAWRRIWQQEEFIREEPATELRGAWPSHHERHNQNNLSNSLCDPIHIHWIVSP